MSLKRNIVTNYFSQFYITIIGVVMVPLYIKYMGIEAYGLVGFYAMLQSWFMLLDMGLTPTIARETARFRGGAIDASIYLNLFYALEGVFFVVAILGGIVLFFSSGYMAREWLMASKISVSEIMIALELIAVIIALRWICGLYRGVISGSERLVWLGVFNSIIATLRFVIIIPILIYINSTVKVYFIYQCIVAVIELIVLILYNYSLLPENKKGRYSLWSWQPIKPVFKLSMSIAVSSSLWIFVTQMDKLVLSKILSLSDYGYFTLGVIVSNGVMIISFPISATIMPRMSKLHAQGDHDSFIHLYRKATQLVAILAGGAAVTIAFYAEPLLWVWTGDKILSHQSAAVLILYSLGNGVLCLSSFPYYMQYAKGNLNMHLMGNTLFAIILLPLIVWGANKFGGIGAGFVWLGMNLLSFSVWQPQVHRKFEPGLNIKWYTQDTLLIIFSSTLVVFLLSTYLPISEDRLIQLFKILFVGIIAVISGSMASSEIRNIICLKWMLNK